MKATSLGYQPSTELIHAVSVAVRDPASARERGVQFNGASYTCVRADQWAVYGKKVCTIISCDSYSESHYGMYAFRNREDL